LGGYGSGRSYNRPTIEGCASYIMNINKLVRAGLRRGIIGNVTWPYDDGFAVEIEINTMDDGWPHLQVSHLPYTDDDERVRYTIGLQWTHPHFGGVRWWFVCPRTQERCGKLILPNGGQHFRSRKAYRLGYQSQGETRIDRAARRSRKLLARLGGDEAPIKPKWMRWRTFEQLEARWYQAEAEWDLLFAGRAARFLGLS
jgi:hypothetical protein